MHGPLKSGAQLPKEPLRSQVLRDWGFDPEVISKMIEEGMEDAAKMKDAMKRPMQVERRNVCTVNRWIEGSRSDY